MDSTFKGSLSSPAHEMVERYMRVNRLHRSVLDRLFVDTGVHRSQHRILMYIADNPNVSQKEIAKLHGVSTATIAVSLKKLEKGEYIERIVDERDNRFNQIRITEKGKKVVADSVCIFKQVEDCMFEGFTKKEYEVMGMLFDRIYKNLQRDIILKTESEDL